MTEIEILKEYNITIDKINNEINYRQNNLLLECAVVMILSY